MPKYEFREVGEAIGRAVIVARSDFLGGTTISYESPELPIKIETSHGRFRPTSTRLFVRDKQVATLTGGIAEIGEGEIVAVMDALNAADEGAAPAAEPEVKPEPEAAEDPAAQPAPPSEKPARPRRKRGEPKA